MAWPRAPQAVGVGGMLVCAALLFTQLFDAAFDLPPEARNLSPFDSSIFRLESVAPASLESLVQNTDLRRLAVWVVVILGSWLVVRFAPPARRFGELAWRGFVRIPERPYVVTVVSLQFVLGASLSFFVFERMPHVQDAIGQWFQAQVLAGGDLWVEPSPLSGLFSYFTLVETTDRWYSQHPPGFSLLLAPFVRLGLAWLVNPLLGAAASLVTWLLARRLFDDPTARLVPLFFLASPFHGFMSASFMNHTATMFFLVLAAWLLVDSHGETGWRDAAAGLCLGYAVTIRPWTALWVGAGCAVAVLWQTPMLRQRIRRAALVAAGSALPILMLFLYNGWLNGDALTFGYQVADPIGHRLGFLQEPFAYTPFAALIKTDVLIRALDLHLFAWPVASLWFVFLLFGRGRATARDYALVAVATLLPAAYFFYWFQDMCLGPRFLYETIPAWILLSARGFVRSGSEEDRPSAASALLLCLCLGWAVSISWPDRIARYSDSYWKVDRRMVDAVEEADLGSALVLVSAETCHPWYYGAGLWANTPRLDGDVIYSRDPGPAGVAELSRLFPERELFRWDCDARRLSEP